MKVKEESEKIDLKLNIQKTNIIASNLISSWQIYGQKVETVTDFIFLGSKVTAAHQVPLSMGFSRQEYWSGLPFPSPRDFPNPEMEPWSPALQADSLPTELQGKHHVSACMYAKLLSHVASLRPYEPYRLPSSLV